MKTNYLGLVRLQVGDVVPLFGQQYIVDLVNQSNARVVPLVKKRVKIETIHGDKAEFDQVQKAEHISAYAESDTILERSGKQGLEDFLAGRKGAGRKGENNASNNEKESNMSKDKSKNKNSKNGNGETTSRGKLGDVEGFSVVSVLRLLGKKGISTAHARAIIKAYGIKASDTTVSIQVNNGRHGKGEMAGLTGEQYKKLVALAPEPEEEETTTKSKGKGKGGKTTKSSGKGGKARGTKPATKDDDEKPRVRSADSTEDPAEDPEVEEVEVD